MAIFYLLFSTLLFQLIAADAYAGDPVVVNKATHAGLMYKSASANKIQTLAPLKMDALNTSGSLSSGVSNESIIAKGVRTTAHVLDLLNQITAKQEFNSLSLYKRHTTNTNAAIGIVDFVSSLSRLSAHYAFSRNCNFYSKFILTSRTANFGLNF